MSSATAMYTDAREEEDFQKASRNAKQSLFPPRSINDVFSRYLVADKERLSVVLFLSRHQPLIDILLEADAWIDSIFGDAQRNLAIEVDPEGGPAELFCVIVSDSDPVEALRLLRRFDDIYLTQTTGDKGNCLNFTVDTRDDESI